MYELTKEKDISGIIAAADRPRIRIAEAADIIFFISQCDPAAKICSNLEMLALAINMQYIPDVDAVKKYVYISKMLDYMNETERKLALLSRELGTALTELYKKQELLRTLLEEIEENTEKLNSCENSLNAILDEKSADSETERLIIMRQIQDIKISEVIASRNCQQINQQTEKTAELISAVKSVDTVLLPLWRSQIAQAHSSLNADDIRRAYETAHLAFEKVCELVKGYRHNTADH